jgi:hypothetical protein
VRLVVKEIVTMNKPILQVPPPCDFFGNFPEDNYPIKLAVIHTQDRLSDLDAPIIKWLLDALVNRLGIPDDSQQYIEWGDKPVRFRKCHKGEFPNTYMKMYKGTMPDVSIQFPFPMPLYNRLPKNTMAMVKLKGMVRYVAETMQVSQGLVYHGYTMEEMKGYLHFPTDNHGNPLWKRPMTWATFADRYYKFVLGRKRIPLKFRKYFE